MINSAIYPRSIQIDRLDQIKRFYPDLPAPNETSMSKSENHFIPI